MSFRRDSCKGSGYFNSGSNGVWQMNTVLTAVVGIGMIVLCLVSMWAVVREMRALCAYERDTMNVWRRQTRLARLAQEDAQQAKFWAEADAMIEGARR